MSVPLKLRGDFTGNDIRGHARRCKDGAQVRRLLAIATILGSGLVDHSQKSTVAARARAE